MANRIVIAHNVRAVASDCVGADGRGSGVISEGVDRASPPRKPSERISLAVAADTGIANNRPEVLVESRDC